MPSDKSYSGYVYLIGSRRFGWFKIGKSTRPEIRMEEIGILLPFKIELFAVWGTKNHSALEGAFHREYAEHHIHGEWFLLNLSLLDKIVMEYPPYWADRIFPGGERVTKEIAHSTLEDKTKKVSDVDFRTRKQHYIAFKEAVAKEIANGIKKSRAKQRVCAKVRNLWDGPIEKFINALES